MILVLTHLAAFIGGGLIVGLAVHWWMKDRRTTNTFGMRG